MASVLGRESSGASYLIYFPSCSLFLRPIYLSLSGFTLEYQDGRYRYVLSEHAYAGVVAGRSGRRHQPDHCLPQPAHPFAKRLHSTRVSFPKRAASETHVRCCIQVSHDEAPKTTLPKAVDILSPISTIAVLDPSSWLMIGFSGEVGWSSGAGEVIPML